MEYEKLLEITKNNLFEIQNKITDGEDVETISSTIELLEKLKGDKNVRDTGTNSK